MNICIAVRVYYVHLLFKDPLANSTIRTERLRNSPSCCTFNNTRHFVMTEKRNPRSSARVMTSMSSKISKGWPTQHLKWKMHNGKIVSVSDKETPVPHVLEILGVWPSIFLQMTILVTLTTGAKTVLALGLHNTPWPKKWRHIYWSGWDSSYIL